MLPYLFDFLLVLLIMFFIRHFVLMLVRVKGRSMLSTLDTGDWLLVTRFDYRLHGPARGDVIICRYPGRFVDARKLIPQHFVKRLIALPGETIAIEDGVVLINGEPLDEPYLDPVRVRYRRSMQPRTLGADEYFVMGDHRDASNDSRRIGPIPRRMIIGHARRVIFPLRRIGRISGS